MIEVQVNSNPLSAKSQINQYQTHKPHYTLHLTPQEIYMSSINKLDNTRR